jgi:hypothetical protein
VENRIGIHGGKISIYPMAVDEEFLEMVRVINLEMKIKPKSI